MSDNNINSVDKAKPLNFIEQIISDDLATGKHQEIATRFPPEPNGYLHIGHAKSICLNFGLVDKFPGRCYLRFDDTNPLKEEEEFVQAIIADVKWLGANWEAINYTSDYYQSLYEVAIHLINNGLAYVDDLNQEEIREYRGTLTTKGRESPYRTRSIPENLDLFTKMKDGAFPDGKCVLRAKIDMQSGNLNMRDPVIYRIRHASHQRTGDAWCIYPMYDFAHPLSDAFENITHSLCTLEFQDHRPFYDWLIINSNLKSRPIQTEFARLNLSHTLTSKRKLRELVESNVVDGWDDPRMPTISGMRSRGYPPKAIKNFCEIIGISKSDSIIDLSILEECVRSELNQNSKRMLAVVDPIKIVIENYPSDLVENLKASYYPQSDVDESRILPFSKEIYIDSSDFMENPSKGFFRLAVGQEVRLRHAYIIKCVNVIKDSLGSIIEIRCTYDKDTLGKNPVDRKVKGVIHWVNIATAKKVNIVQFDRLFTDANPACEENFMQFLNKDSKVLQTAFCEPEVANLNPSEIVQLERIGYYKVALHNSEKSLHRVVELKSNWEKIKV